ncbi:MAG TPA: hypothetical protein VE057_22420 [Archangium sp.]|nr:hypothetical protein [Archangium sp.]
MDIQHQQAFPVLSAFGLEDDVEDGLTDSHRPVLATDLCRRAREAGLPAGVQASGQEEDSRVWVSPAAPVYEVVRRVEGFLGWWGRCASARVSNEELGDALELLHKLVGAGVPAWMLYAQAGVSAFWALVHSVQDAALRLTGKPRLR